LKINGELVIDFERLEDMDLFNRNLLYFKLLIPKEKKTTDNFEKFKGI
jgi:hypothetical protein